MKPFVSFDLNDYVKIKFRITKSQHICIKASLNGVLGNFILDTGASNTCVGEEFTEKYNLITKISKTKASGAGTNEIDTKISRNNSIKIGRWKSDQINLVLFDLSHVNQALISYKTKPVDGIIGSDIFMMSDAIINYNHQYLYLKKV